MTVRCQDFLNISSISCGLVSREHREGSKHQFSPDNPEFVTLANIYSSRHTLMSRVGLPPL